MNNEPVAWMSPDGRFSTTEGKLFYIPLYTHPAKTLTDEEIVEVFESPFHPNTTGKINDEVIAFAKAILRKAQEKC